MVKVKENYEDYIARLEEITEKLEKGDLTLEDSLRIFEEGINLVKKCSKILNEAEGKIKVLSENLEGEFVFKDFDGGQEIEGI